MATPRPSHKRQLTGRSHFALGFALVAASALLLRLGGVLFVGPLLVSLAPDLLAAGVTLVVFAPVSRFLRNGLPRWVAAAALFCVVALNTRAFALLEDMLDGMRAREQIGPVQRANASQPLHVEFTGDKLAARRAPFAAAVPACRGDGCFVTEGFRHPSIDLDYWEESPLASAKAIGFIVARDAESAPTLKVYERHQGSLLWVHLRLLDAAGNELASARYRYRNGFPREPSDPQSPPNYRGHGDEIKSFLLHNNTLARILGNGVQRSPPYPVRHFLAAKFSVKETFWSAGVLPESIDAPRHLPLEILQQEVFDPMIVIVDAGRSAEFKSWREKGWDAERSKFCDTMLKRESSQERAGIVQVWWLFVQDPTGRRKMRRSAHELCEPDVIWSYDYSAVKDSVQVTKYSPQGEMLYRIAFRRPAPIYGFQGGIQAKTFRAEGGYLTFEWVDLHWAGYDLQVKRNMLVRLVEPPTGR